MADTERKTKKRNFTQFEVEIIVVMDIQLPQEVAEHEETSQVERHAVETTWWLSRSEYTSQWLTWGSGRFRWNRNSWGNTTILWKQWWKWNRDYCLCDHRGNIDHQRSLDVIKLGPPSCYGLTALPLHAMPQAWIYQLLPYYHKPVYCYRM